MYIIDEYYDDTWSDIIMKYSHIVNVITKLRNPKKVRAYLNLIEKSVLFKAATK